MTVQINYKTNIQKISGPNDGAYTGIYFNFKDLNNYIGFYITGDGYYLIDREIEGINFEIKDWTRSNKINKYNASNTLKILRFGESFV